MANGYYPVYYQNPYGGYLSYQQPQQQQNNTQNIKSMEWVEGEVGARAYQMPQSWAANTPIPLWDSTQNRIYFKSWNQVGMANPLLYVDYSDAKELKNMNALPEGSSGDHASKYATKEDLDDLKQEIKNLSNMISNNQGNRNRGGQ